LNVRRLLLITAFIVLALVAVLFIAVSLIDPDRLRQPIVARLSDQLDRSVELGELDLALFPALALRVRAVRVEGSSPEAPPLLEVGEVRLRVAVLPLFLGRVVLRALELKAPRVRIELDPQGRPKLPGAMGREAPAADAADARGTEEEGATLAVDTIEISDGSLEAGPWKVENLELRGRLRLDRSAELAFQADVADLGKLREARAELEGLGTDALSVTCRGEIREGDLAEIKQRLELEPELAGRLDGNFELSFRDGAVRDMRVDLRGSELQVASGALQLVGEVDLDAQLGGPWRVDLTRSRLDLGETIRKPVGLKASLSGLLGPEVSPTAVRDALVVIGSNELRLALDLGKKPLSVNVQPATLELEPLGKLVRSELRSLTGRVKLDAWQVQLEPLALSGSAMLEDVTLGLQHGSVSFTGPLHGAGARLHGTEIRMLAGGESATFSGSYDIPTGVVSLDGSVSGAKLEVLAQALVGHSELAGTLEGGVKVKGPLDVTALVGSGKLDITNGRIRGFSLMKRVLGDLAALPLLMARVKGRDLSRYEEEEFQRLAADFRLREGRLHMDEILLEYRHATAQLHGSVGVLDGSLALAGKLVIARDVDAALAGQETAQQTGQATRQQRVIPIAGIGGTVSRPRVRLDAAALAAVAATYAGQGELREKLEKKIGREGAEAVESILDQLLRGRKEEP
jgi:hypothetical protein